MKKNGFTLIELLVVIGIIGILSAITIASLSSARAKARDAERIVSLKEMQKALDLYYADHEAYPADKNSLISDKYISEINPNIRYVPAINADGSDYGNQRCSAPTDTCKSYLLGIELEKNNPVLNSDKDFYDPGQTSVFNGLSPAEGSCRNTAITTPDNDRCYDLTSF